MKQRFINLLKQVQEKSGDDTAYFIYHTDHSGAVVVHEKELFDFMGEDNLETMLKEYLKN